MPGIKLMFSKTAAQGSYLHEGKDAVMRWLQPKILLVSLATLLAIGSAWASSRHVSGHGHRHTHVGVTFGFPLASPWYYGPPDYYAGYYAYPPVITVPAPSVYIEQNSSPQTTGQESNYWWYYCQSKQSYYPYVQECPQGWQRVAPQPPDLR